MKTPNVSKDPDENWENNDIQFPRLIAELEACGALTNEVLHELADSLDCNLEELDELIERAVDAWDAIKART
jgi:galactokinase